MPVPGMDRVRNDNPCDRALGHPRTIQRSDGRIVTVCYFKDVSSNDRYIVDTDNQYSL